MNYALVKLLVVCLHFWNCIEINMKFKYCRLSSKMTAMNPLASELVQRNEKIKQTVWCLTSFCWHKIVCLLVLELKYSYSPAQRLVITSTKFYKILEICKYNCLIYKYIYIYV